ILLLPGGLLVVVSLFDGEHSIADIQAAIMRQHGELVSRERITEIADALDEQGFLDSPHFAERRAAIDHAFLEAPTRPAAHGGGAYPLDPSEIHAFFDGFFAPPEGPGPVDGSGPGRPRVAGIIAPHIDFHRGRSAYATSSPAGERSRSSRSSRASPTRRSSAADGWTMTRGSRVSSRRSARRSRRAGAGWP